MKKASNADLNFNDPEDVFYVALGYDGTITMIGKNSQDTTAEVVDGNLIIEQANYNYTLEEQINLKYTEDGTEKV